MESYKRLDKGRFAKLWRSEGSALSLTMSELSLFLEGSELVGKRALSPAPITHAELAAKIALQVKPRRVKIAQVVAVDRLLNFVEVLGDPVRE